MNKIEQILKSDFIISIATFLEDEKLNDSIKKAVKDNGAKFVYMHPIDNFNLKSFYSQLIKYEVGSEEGISALLLNSFASNSDEKTKTFLDDLDLGYISAESSAGEEEFEEAFENSLNSKIKTLIIGDDLVNHERVENIVKLLAIIKKYSDFNLVILNENLEENLSTVLLPSPTIILGVIPNDII
jgi:NADH-quinone oxidoreductase subunit F